MLLHLIAVLLAFALQPTIETKEIELIVKSTFFMKLFFNFRYFLREVSSPPLFSEFFVVIILRWYLF